MKKSTFKNLVLAGSFIGLIACQKIKKEEAASFADWQKVEDEDAKTLEKEAGSKVTNLLSCRVRPVENYHIYYTLDISEKQSSKDTKVNGMPVKLYDEALFGNYFYSNANKTVSRTKLKTKKVKALLRKEELINVYEVYEKIDSTQLTRAEEEDLKKLEEQKLAELKKTTEASASKTKDEKEAKDLEAAKNKQVSDKEKEKNTPNAVAAIGAAAETVSNTPSKSEDKKTEAPLTAEKMSDFDSFKKGYRLVFAVKKHSTTGEVKNITNYSNNMSYEANSNDLKGVTLECQ